MSTRAMRLRVRRLERSAAPAHGCPGCGRDDHVTYRVYFAGDPAPPEIPEGERCRVCFHGMRYRLTFSGAALQPKA